MTTDEFIAARNRMIAREIARLEANRPERFEMKQKTWKDYVVMTDQQNPTRVFYKFNTSDYIELKFLRWTPAYLVVEFPAGSLNAGKEWKMGRPLVNRYLNIGVLRIEGDIPAAGLIF